jgi:P-type Ca2+ transporter type 2C
MVSGLPSPVARQKLAEFGYNEITSEKTFSVLSLFLAQFPTFLNGILVVAAMLSFFVGDALDGIFILAIIVLNAIIGFFQEFKAEKSLEKLQSYMTNTVRVIRDGKEEQIATRLLVPGDVVVLSEGDRIPADGSLTRVHHAEVDESILTGESLAVIKADSDVAYFGTLLTKGKAQLVVTHTGMRTKFGQIAQTLSDITPETTPLQKQLDTLGRNITLLVLILAFLLIPIGAAQGKSLLPLLFLAISIAVAAIPVSLPTVITVALALGTNRMAKQNAIVRQMASVETLGAVQIILVDKTGTLTQNKMRVKRHWLMHKDYFPAMLQACILGNTASLIQKETGHDYDVVGDRTDGALLLYAKEALPRLDLIIQDGDVTDEYVFDSVTKTITTVWTSHKRKYVFVRGAPESIMGKSLLSDEEKARIEEEIASFAKNGLRVIGFGYKTEEHLEAKSREHIESHLTFLGIMGIYDPPRSEVKHAIAQGKAAGIKTVMVTGDNELTALAIAKEIGLIEKDENVVTGDELAKLTDDQVIQLLPKTNIFARSQPHDKYRITTLLKQQGFVIGVTGDGVNDALALKKADVGVAMGQSGTDVAKEASDIILTDDNFATLVKAIEEGRTIYKNILKSIIYLLAGNLSEISLVFFAAVLGLPHPLLPTQILWINLVTDGLPALALAGDNHNPRVLHEKPRDPKLPILTKDRLLFILSVGFGLSAFLLLLFLGLLHYTSEEKARTIIFNVLILSHMTIALAVRKQSIFRANKLLLITVIGTVALQILITTTPFFQRIFHLSF